LTTKIFAIFETIFIFLRKWLMAGHLQRVKIVTFPSKNNEFQAITRLLHLETAQK
jgi:hypothetical protein